MQRSYLLCSLAVAIGLLGTQCVDSISDDCTKTLTCDDEQPVLGNDCVWRYPDGSNRVWAGGPQYDETTNRWRWPDGKETATQDFPCDLSDAGADAGSGIDCRRGTACDLPQVCDIVTGDCVECLEDTECSGNMPMGDAGAATTCDQATHECVRCLDDADCMGGVCKQDLSSSSGNVCVECEVNEHCGGDRPICDTATNECTASCTSNTDCRDDKPACNTTRNLCVECLDSGACMGAGATQCNLSTNECVECLDNTPCTPSNRICDIASNTCVECGDDTQCAARPDAATRPFCEVEDNLCVECLNDTQCTDSGASRCNPVLHACVGCNSDSQCENGLLCNGAARCVECVDNANCTTSLVGPLCDTAAGRCVECLNADDSECRTPDAARCQTDPTFPQHLLCVGCDDNAQCANKPFSAQGPLCNTVTGNCVSCITNAECTNPTASLCGNGGTCAICNDNDDCDLFNGQDGRPLARACRDGVGCVECTVNGDCGGAEPRCKVIDTGESAGDAPVNSCVECVDNDDCPGAGESRCVNNACAPCAVDLDCAHVDSNGTTAGGVQLDVCDAGTCVQCTAGNRTACNNNVCNGLTKTCTTFPVDSADFCEPCVSDAQCDPTARCVQMTPEQYFCIPLQPDGCPSTGPTRGFLGEATVATIDTTGATEVCVPRLATCPAFVSYRAGTACDGATDDAECGPGGACEPATGGGFRCTIPCELLGDCTSATCFDDLCEL